MSDYKHETCKEIRRLILDIWYQTSDNKHHTSDIVEQTLDATWDVWYQTLEIRRLMSDIRRLTSVMYHQTSDIRQQTVDIYRLQMSDVSQLTSDIKHQRSDIRCLTWDNKHQTSGIRQETWDIYKDISRLILHVWHQTTNNVWHGTTETIDATSDVCNETLEIRRLMWNNKHQT